MRINKERPARKDGHSHVKSNLSSYIGSSYKRNGQRAKSFRDIPPSAITGLGIYRSCLWGLLRKPPEARNGFPVGADLCVRPIAGADLLERFGRTRRSAPTKDTNALPSGLFQQAPNKINPLNPPSPSRRRRAFPGVSCPRASPRDGPCRRIPAFHPPG